LQYNATKACSKTNKEGTQIACGPIGEEKVGRIKEKTWRIRREIKIKTKAWWDWCKEKGRRITAQNRILKIRVLCHSQLAPQKWVQNDPRTRIITPMGKLDYWVL
jgi:hypothetical protein